MRSMKSELLRGVNGQSLIEAGLLLPLLLLLTFNAVNLGYCFYSYLNMASGSRQGAEYSIQGPHSIGGNLLPTNDQIQSLVSEDITSAIHGGSTALMRVCAQGSGLDSGYTGANQIPTCSSYGGSGGNFGTNDPNCTGTGAPPICPDPEAVSGLILNRIDIQYTVSPLIDGAAFNLVVPNLTFHRHIYMRNIN